MKYFGRDFAQGLDEDERQRRVEEYFHRHIPRIAERLPAELASFVAAQARGDRGSNLHDGVVTEVRYSRATRALALEVCAGDLEQGYCTISLSFGDVTNLAQAVAELIAATSRREVILYDEIGALEPRGVRLCLLFSGAAQVEIRFGTFHVQVAPRTARVALASEPTRVVELEG